MALLENELHRIEMDQKLCNEALKQLCDLSTNVREYYGYGIYYSDYTELVGSINVAMNAVSKVQHLLDDEVKDHLIYGSANEISY